MKASIGRQSVSAVVILSVLLASVAVFFSGSGLGGTVYQAPITHVDGDEKTANLGRSVTIMDLNGDHIGDLVVGVPYASAYGLSQAGAVRVYLSSGGVAMANLIVINGTHTKDLFGWCVANISDVNGDGMSDLAVGSPLADPGPLLIDAGNVSIFYGWPEFDGKPNVTIDGETAGEQFGFSIASAGDIMVDGMDDVIVGAPFYDSGTIANVGRVDIFYGGNPMNSVADRTLYGNTADGQFGYAVSGGVNIDQDATLDMVIGAPGVPINRTAGAAYIYRNLDRANPSQNVVTAKAADDGFGSSVALVRDLNADTFGEVAIGAPYNNDHGSDAGSVSIILGASKFRTDIDITLVGSPNEWFGFSIASGNILLDRYSDIIVGAPMSRLNATPDTPIGRAYAYYGGSVWTEPNLTLVPDPGASFFGGCVVIGDNLTGDSASDFAVGDPMFSLVGLENAGRVYVYAGVKPSIPYVPKNPVVEGHVYVPGTSIGLQGFTVTLESSADQWSSTTNAAGFYQMTAVPGTYWLNASRADYVANSTTVTLAMDDVKTENFYPMKVPIVTGVVRDNVTANLIRGAKVALYDGTTLVTEVTTPANGSFWIPLPTAYVPPEGASATLTLKSWDQTHYTSPSNFTIARNEIGWVNFTLDSFPVVKGTVRDAIDFSAVRGTITADQGGTIIAITATDIRGAYTLIAVNASEPARLFLNATAPGHYRTPDWVDVQKNGTYTVDFLLQRDTTKPTSQLAALTQYTATVVVTLSATASDANGIKEVQLWYKNEGAGSYSMYVADSTSPYEFSFDSSATGGDGIYEFYSIAVDWADNTEDAPGTNDTWTIMDSHAPTLTITSPIAGQLFAVSTVDAAWTGSDPASGIASFFTRIDGGSWVNRGGNLSATFTNLADGNHTVEVNATDRAGHSALDSVTFSVDTVKPVVTITAPANNSALTSASITLQWSASDVGSGLKTIQVSKDGTAWESVDINKTEFVFYGPSGIAEGAYTLYVRAADRGGLTTTATVDMVLDRTNPTVTITFPISNQKLKESKVTVGWAMLETGSGISLVRISIDGGAFVSVGSATSYDIATLADGTHNVTVRVTDHAGNYAEATVEFTISTGGGISSIMMGAIALAIIVAIVAGVLLMKRKKGPVPEKKEPGK